METKLANGLLILRITISIVFIMWTGDKFFNPVHAQNVWTGFYFMPELGKAIFLGIGVVEIILIALFLAGIFKDITYAMILIAHTISTLAPFEIYLNAYTNDNSLLSEPNFLSDYNLLFFTAFPMWGACLFLYMFRKEDTKFTFSK